MIAYKEVKQCKGELNLVMEKLEKVGSVVINVDNMCRNHGKNMEDLPAEFRGPFESFQRYRFPLLNVSLSNPNQAT
jgi:hypothetical protein